MRDVFKTLLLLSILPGLLGEETEVSEPLTVSSFSSSMKDVGDTIKDKILGNAVDKGKAALESLGVVDVITDLWEDDTAFGNLLDKVQTALGDIESVFDDSFVDSIEEQLVNTANKVTSVLDDVFEVCSEDSTLVRKASSLETNSTERKVRGQSSGGWPHCTTVMTAGWSASYEGVNKAGGIKLEGGFGLGASFGFSKTGSITGIGGGLDAGISFIKENTCPNGVGGVETCDAGSTCNREEGKCEPKSCKGRNFDTTTCPAGFACFNQKCSRLSACVSDSDCSILSTGSKCRSGRCTDAGVSSWAGAWSSSTTLDWEFFQEPGGFSGFAWILDLSLPEGISSEFIKGFHVIFGLPHYKCHHLNPSAWRDQISFAGFGFTLASDASEFIKLGSGIKSFFSNPGEKLRELISIPKKIKDNFSKVEYLARSIDGVGISFGAAATIWDSVDKGESLFSYSCEEQGISGRSGRTTSDQSEEGKAMYDILELAKPIMTSGKFETTFCAGSCTPSVVNSEAISASCVIGPSDTCDALVANLTVDSMTLGPLLYLLTGEDSSVHGTISTIMSPFSGFGIKDVTGTLEASTDKTSISFMGTPTISETSEDWFLSRVEDGIDSLIVELSGTLYYGSGLGFEGGFRVALEPIQLGDQVWIENSAGTYGMSLYSGFKYTTLTGGRSLTTVSFPMKICVEKCGSESEVILVLEGELGMTVTPTSQTILGTLTMDGTWWNALGIPFIHVSNVQIGIGADLKGSGLPTEFRIGAEVCLGSQGNCEERDEEYVVALAYLGVSATLPENNYFIGMVSELTFQNLVDILDDYIPGLSNLNLPEWVGKSGIKPFSKDAQCSDSSLSDEEKDQNCFARVSFNPGPLPVTISFSGGDIEIPSGISVSGRLNLGGWEVAVEAEVNPKLRRIKIDAWMDKVSIKDFLYIGKELDNNGGVTDEGPRFLLEMSPRSVLADIGGAISIPSIGASGEVSVELNSDRFELSASLDLFNGLWNPSVYAYWDWDFSEIMMKLENLNLGLVSIDEISLVYASGQAAFSAKITVMGISVSAKLEVSKAGSYYRIKFDISTGTSVAGMRVQGSVLVATRITDIEFDLTVTTYFDAGAAIEGVKKALVSVANGAKRIWNTVSSKVKSVFSGIKKSVFWAVSSVFSGGLKTFLNKLGVNDALKNLKNIASETINKLRDLARNIAKKVWGAVTSGLDALKGLGKFIKKASETLSKLFGGSKKNEKVWDAQETDADTGCPVKVLYWKQRDCFICKWKSRNTYFVEPDCVASHSERVKEAERKAENNVDMEERVDSSQEENAELVGIESTNDVPTPDIPSSQLTATISAGGSAETVGVSTSASATPLGSSGSMSTVPVSAVLNFTNSDSLHASLKGVQDQLSSRISSVFLESQSGPSDGVRADAESLGQVQTYDLPKVFSPIAKTVPCALIGSTAFYDSSLTSGQTPEIFVDPMCKSPATVSALSSMRASSSSSCSSFSVQWSISGGCMSSSSMSHTQDYSQAPAIVGYTSTDCSGTWSVLTLKQSASGVQSIRIPLGKKVSFLTTKGSVSYVAHDPSSSGVCIQVSSFLETGDSLSSVDSITKHQYDSISVSPPSNAEVPCAVRSEQLFFDSSKEVNRPIVKKDPLCREEHSVSILSKSGTSCSGFTVTWRVSGGCSESKDISQVYTGSDSVLVYTSSFCSGNPTLVASPGNELLSGQYFFVPTGKILHLENGNSIAYDSDGVNACEPVSSHTQQGETAIVVSSVKDYEYKDRVITDPVSKEIPCFEVLADDGVTVSSISVGPKDENRPVVTIDSQCASEDSTVSFEYTYTGESCDSLSLTWTIRGGCEEGADLYSTSYTGSFGLGLYTNGWCNNPVGVAAVGDTIDIESYVRVPKRFSATIEFFDLSSSSAVKRRLSMSTTPFSNPETNPCLNLRNFEETGKSESFFGRVVSVNEFSYTTIGEPSLGSIGCVSKRGVVRFSPGSENSPVLETDWRCRSTASSYIFELENGAGYDSCPETTVVTYGVSGGCLLSEVEVNQTYPLVKGVALYGTSEDPCHPEFSKGTLIPGGSWVSSATHMLVPDDSAAVLRHPNSSTERNTTLIPTGCVEVASLTGGLEVLGLSKIIGWTYKRNITNPLNNVVSCSSGGVLDNRTFSEPSVEVDALCVEPVVFTIVQVAETERGWDHCTGYVVKWQASGGCVKDSEYFYATYTVAPGSLCLCPDVRTISLFSDSSCSEYSGLLTSEQPLEWDDSWKGSYVRIPDYTMAVFRSTDIDLSQNYILFGWTQYLLQFTSYYLDNAHFTYLTYSREESGKCMSVSNELERLNPGWTYQQLIVTEWAYGWSLTLPQDRFGGEGGWEGGEGWEGEGEGSSGGSPTISCPASGTNPFSSALDISGMQFNPSIPLVYTESLCDEPVRLEAGKASGTEWNGYKPTEYTVKWQVGGGCLNETQREQAGITVYSTYSTCSFPPSQAVVLYSDSSCKIPVDMLVTGDTWNTQGTHMVVPRGTLLQLNLSSSSTVEVGYGVTRRQCLAVSDVVGPTESVTGVTVIDNFEYSEPSIEYPAVGVVQCVSTVLFDDGVVVMTGDEHKPVVTVGSRCKEEVVVTRISSTRINSSSDACSSVTVLWSISGGCMVDELEYNVTYSGNEITAAVLYSDEACTEVSGTVESGSAWKEASGVVFPAWMKAGLTTATGGDVSVLESATCLNSLTDSATSSSVPLSQLASLDTLTFFDMTISAPPKLSISAGECSSSAPFDSEDSVDSNLKPVVSVNSLCGSEAVVTIGAVSGITSDGWGTCTGYVVEWIVSGGCLSEEVNFRSAYTVSGGTCSCPIVPSATFFTDSACTTISSKSYGVSEGGQWIPTEMSALYLTVPTRAKLVVEGWGGGEEGSVTVSPGTYCTQVGSLVPSSENLTTFSVLPLEPTVSEPQSSIVTCGGSATVSSVLSDVHKPLAENDPLCNEAVSITQNNLVKGTERTSEGCTGFLVGWTVSGGCLSSPVIYYSRYTPSPGDTCTCPDDLVSGYYSDQDCSTSYTTNVTSVSGVTGSECLPLTIIGIESEVLSVSVGGSS